MSLRDDDFTCGCAQCSVGIKYLFFHEPFSANTVKKKITINYDSFFSRFAIY